LQGLLLPCASWCASGAQVMYGAVDPFLTMRSKQQPLATDGNGFRLFMRLRLAVDLPLIAAGCDPGAP
jgi:hypothetical protein